MVANRAVFLLRIGMLALFALTLTVQPVLASVGELHELEHVPAGTHLFTWSGSPVSPEDSSSRGSLMDPEQILHVLIELAHSDGTTASLTHGFAPVGSVSRARLRLPAGAFALPSDPMDSPLRPPIFA